MAKVYQLVIDGSYTQAKFDEFSHSLLFADSIQPVFTQTEGGSNNKSVIVTSGVDSSGSLNGSGYELLADDSRSEAAITVSTGKFVEGNLIAVLCPSAEAQADMRNYMTFYALAGDIHLHIGLCNTTQSQDYTPDIIANNRVIKMITPAQVKNLGL
jgi:HJR/Mrr/RecB family endonuclease